LSLSEPRLICGFYSDNWLLKHRGKWRINKDGRAEKEYFVKVTMDFTPTDGGGYDFNWPGPPRREWLYSDRKEYTPTFSFRYGEPPIGALDILIKEDKTGSDPVLARGMYHTGQFWIFNRQLSVSRGAPIRTDGVFWLVCTKLGRIKGDYGKGDDRHAKVYMEVVPKSFGGEFCKDWVGGPLWAVHINSGNQSPRHTVRAK